MNNLKRTIFMAIFGPLYFGLVEPHDSRDENHLVELENEKWLTLPIIFLAFFWICIFVRIRDNHWDSYGIGALSIYLVFWSLYNHLMRSSLMKRLRKNIYINIIVFFWNTHWLPIICYTMLVFLMTRKNDMYVERIVPIGLNWLYIAIIFSICVAVVVYLYRLWERHFDSTESPSKPKSEEVESTESKTESFFFTLIFKCVEAIWSAIWAALRLAACLVGILLVLLYFSFIITFLILPVRQQL